MKAFLIVCIGAIVSLEALGDSDIDLGGKLTTFTNLQGRVFENVLLQRATLDGVIYGITNGIGGGMVKYKDLSPEFLTNLNIPAERIEIAQKRDEVRALQKQRFDAAVRALALKQQQQQALEASNALAQANALAAAEANAATNGAAGKVKAPPKASAERRR